MKRIYLSNLTLLVVFLLGLSARSAAQVITSTFMYTGTVQTYQIGTGITQISFDAVGANGGNNASSADPGLGGRVQGMLAVTPGEILYIYVGQVGVNGYYSCSFNTSAWNGGGAPYYQGGGGGGATDVRLSNVPVNSYNATSGNAAYRVIVAGAGGGGGANDGTCTGGKGGGLTGGNGLCICTFYVGTGGSQTGGGTTNYGTAGSLGVGGNSGTQCGYYMGSGGGGYYGGGGAGYYGGGGGGSSFTDPSTVSAFAHTQGYNNNIVPGGNGYFALSVICPTLVSGTISSQTNYCGPGINAPATFSGTPGGQWWSLNPSVATISNTGVITSLSTGVATISYSYSSYCGSLPPVTENITVNPTPAVIFPNPQTFCAGQNQVLNETDPGGTWSVSNPLLVSTSSVGTAGNFAGLAGGNVIVTYTEPDGCIQTSTLNVNPAPLNISGLPSVCQGLSTPLSDASTGGNWSSTTPVLASVSSSGVVTAGTVGTGAAIIRYTFPLTGCFTQTTVNVNAVPNSTYLVSPLNSTYCSGGSGSTVNLNHTQAGVSYTLYNGTAPIPPALAGSGSGGLSWPGQTVGGTYHVVATTAAGCSANMSGTSTITVAAPPAVYLLSTPEGTSFCAGSSSPDLVLDSMQIGTNYSLYQNGTLIDNKLCTDPTYPSFDWGADLGLAALGAGCYYVVAGQTSGAGCQDTMANRPCIIMNALPTLQNVTVSNGGVFCIGGAGVHVGLDNSVPGISYQLYNDGVASGLALPGTNASLNFGLHDTGTYTVNATNSLTGCSAGMNGSPMVTYNMLPNQYSMLGTGARCFGTPSLPISISNTDANVDYQLYRNDTVVGVPLVGNAALDTFGYYYTAGNYTAIATDQTTGCKNNMTGSANIMVNPLPVIEPMTPANGYYCDSSTGVVVTLTGTQSGIDYKLQQLGSTTGEFTGTGGSQSFPAQSLAGFYTVLARNPVTGCTNDIEGTNIYVNPRPTWYNVTGGGQYCIGGSGLHVGLDFSEVGINYQLYSGSAMVGSPVAGSNSALDFGVIPAAGTYTVKATNATTSCMHQMSGSTSITINPLPAVYNVINGGSYCAGGSGVAVGLSGSHTGIKYQLYNGSTAVGAAVAGTGTALNFGLQTVAGSYNAKAVDSTTSCGINMSGSKAVSINSLPGTYNVTGGGGYCAGGTGVHVGLSGSNTGVSYQLSNGMTMVGLPKPGTGGVLDFGTFPASGTYTVYATNATTLCANNMNGSAAVMVNPLPTVYAVTGGGNYCAGSAGVHVGLSGSTTGLSYQLNNGSTVMATATGLSGAELDFGLETMPGTYTVSALNTITGCGDNMSGSKTINISILPIPYTVTGGGSFCAGATGRPVGLSGSATGVNYTLSNGGMTLNTISGTGGSLNFGTETMGGSYTVMATSTSTSCTNSMLGNASIVVNPTPNPYSVTGGGSYCSGGTGVHIGLIGSAYGVNYQLMDGAIPVGLPVGGTGAALDMGLQTLAGTFSVKGIDDITGCTNNMLGTQVITITPAVLPTISVADGLSDNTVCAGTTANFSATSTNGGAAPVYEWMVNGTDMGSGASFSYVPANGDIITCQVTSSAACATPMAVSSSITMNVMNYVLPSATVTANPGNNVCPGSSVTFTAMTANGGSSPYNTWILGTTSSSAYTGVAGTSYTYTPSNNDVVTFMMVSNAKCRSTDTVYSMPIVMTVTAPALPVFTISSHLGPVIGVGQKDTLRALVTNGGVATLTYRWFIDGNLVKGANSERFIADTVFNNDTITCIVTAAGECGGAAGVAGVRIHLINLGVQGLSNSGDVKLVPNPNKGYFTLTGTMGSANDEDIAVEVTNVLGQVVYTGTVRTVDGKINERIELSNSLSNGMYLLNLRSGSENAVFHFVIEK